MQDFSLFLCIYFCWGFSYAIFTLFCFQCAITAPVAPARIFLLAGWPASRHQVAKTGDTTTRPVINGTCRHHSGVKGVGHHHYHADGAAHNRATYFYSPTQNPQYALSFTMTALHRS